MCLFLVHRHIPGCTECPTWPLCALVCLLWSFFNTTARVTLKTIRSSYCSLSKPPAIPHLTQNKIQIPIKSYIIWLLPTKSHLCHFQPCSLHSTYIILLASHKNTHSSCLQSYKTALLFATEILAFLLH